MKIDTKHNEITFIVQYRMAANIKNSFLKAVSDMYASDRGFKTADINFSIHLTSVKVDDVMQGKHLAMPCLLPITNHKYTFVPTTSKIGADSNYEALGILFILLLVLMVFLS
jgi:hypothetical protein